MACADSNTGEMLVENEERLHERIDTFQIQYEHFSGEEEMHEFGSGGIGGIVQFEIGIIAIIEPETSLFFFATGNLCQSRFFVIGY